MRKFYQVKGHDVRTYSSVDELIKYQIENRIFNAGDVVKVEVLEKGYQPKLSDFMPDLENDIANNAEGSDFSEYSDTVMESATKAQIKELEFSVGKVIDDWADKYGHQPDFYMLKLVEIIDVELISPEVQ